MPKGYWKAFGQFLKGIGKPLGNAQIPPSANRKGGTTAAMGKNVAIFVYFL
jgi:hypothetical protein